MKKLLIFFAVVGLLGASTAMAGTADIVFIVDESGSMNTEHGWIGGMVTDLDAALVAAGVTDNRFALVGFGNITHDLPGGFSQEAHKHTVNGGDWGTAAQLDTATSGLDLYGGLEDGWQAIQYAMDNYTYRSGGDVATNFVLITDEPRYNSDNSITYANTLSDLSSAGIILNAVVNNYFYTSGGSRALGVADDLTAYQADGAGGFNESANGSAANWAAKTQYVDMAWATGGAGWDLNLLRAGGDTATSFTAAFVDHKVEEIIISIVPLPGAAWMGLVLLGGLGAARLRRRR